MKVWKLDEVKQLVDGFENGTLPLEHWTHHAHIIVSAWHLLNREYYDAILHMKLGIPRYNIQSGGSNSIEKGYHETLTIFWMWAIHAYITSQDDHPKLTIINNLLASPFAKKYLPFFFYSEGLLFTPKARVQWVEPDHRALNAEAINIEYPNSIWYGDDFEG